MIGSFWLFYTTVLTLIVIFENNNHSHALQVKVIIRLFKTCRKWDVSFECWDIKGVWYFFERNDHFILFTIVCE